jgi:glycosyltransferase involved in cell wall biosynthesis
MPAKNREIEIKDTINSIINQTFKDWELIVIDDHSTDKTAEIIKNYKNPKIKYYYLLNGTGPGAARDFGIKKAQAEIIVLADSDDINYPYRLEKTYQTFKKNPEINMVYSPIERLEINGQKTLRPSQEFDPELLWCYNYISQPTVSFKKQAYLQVDGYDFALRTSEDYDLWLQFLEKNCKFKLINEPLVSQKIHEKSTLLQTELLKRKKNLAYVRKKHSLKTPDFENVKKLVQNKDLLELISAPGAIDFWFK